MSKHFIFLGCLFPNEMEKDIYANSKNHVQTAADNFQKKLLKGFEETFKSNIKIITAPDVSSYPKYYKKCFINNNTFSHDNISNDICVGYCNLSIYKQFSYFFNIKRVIYKELKKIPKDDLVILFGYSFYMASILTYAKKIHKNIYSILILPDLPFYISLDRKNIIRDLYKKHLDFKLKKEISKNKIDFYITLTKEMANYLNLKDKFYVIEGICGNIRDKNISKTIKRFGYAGTISRKFGVDNLVNEFKKMNGDFELYLCGGGDDVDYIQQLCKSDSRIKYLGLLKHDKLLEVLDSVDVLINPRENTDEYTKYSFPSKIMEYLTYGKPIICYKLDGIPAEYDDVLFYVNKNKTLKETMEYVSTLTNLSREELYIKIKKFVNKKSALNQCMPIKNIIGGNYDLFKKNIY